METKICVFGIFTNGGAGARVRSKRTVGVEISEEKLGEMVFEFILASVPWALPEHLRLLSASSKRKKGFEIVDVGIQSK
jgi:hypothetical protein